MSCEQAQEKRGETKQRHMAAQAAHRGGQVQRAAHRCQPIGGLRAQSAALGKAGGESG